MQTEFVGSSVLGAESLVVLTFASSETCPDTAAVLGTLA